MTIIFWLFNKGVSNKVDCLK